jgi:hypothetical protein
MRLRFSLFDKTIGKVARISLSLIDSRHKPILTENCPHRTKARTYIVENKSHNHSVLTPTPPQSTPRPFPIRRQCHDLTILTELNAKQELLRIDKPTKDRGI